LRVSFLRWWCAPRENPLKTLCVLNMGSNHSLVVSRGDLARRGWFPYVPTKPNPLAPIQYVQIWSNKMAQGVRIPRARRSRYCGSAEKLHKIRRTSGITFIQVTRAPHSRTLVFCYVSISWLFAKDML
jgi:hypothetical protein